MYNYFFQVKPEDAAEELSKLPSDMSAEWIDQKQPSSGQEPEKTVPKPDLSFSEQDFQGSDGERAEDFSIGILMTSLTARNKIAQNVYPTAKEELDLYSATSLARNRSVESDAVMSMARKQLSDDVMSTTSTNEEESSLALLDPKHLARSIQFLTRPVANLINNLRS